ncbi:MAG: ABC transporter permease, partial [Flavobacteriales bacterium]
YFMTKEIEWLNLIFGYFLLTIPILALLYYRTGLVNDTLIAVGRMTGQLLLVGLYLDIIFEYDKLWINLLWVSIMVVVGGFTIVKRSELKLRHFLLPSFISLLISTLCVELYFLNFVVNAENIFMARLFIPITGILMGNSVRSTVIGLNTYYSELKQKRTLYRYALANGATKKEALMPFMSDAMKKAFNPLIANIAVVGLISLPGVMTGQIIEGSEPMTAIKYQIMLMIIVFTNALLTMLLTIELANKKVIDGRGNLRV